MFESQVNFLIELEKLKSVSRKSLLFDGSRYENSAEHSWSLGMAVMLFAHTANEKIDIAKAIKMAMFHDVVEIYAGDTFAYDESGMEDQFERETEALKKLLSFLEEGEFKSELEHLWFEFEKAESSEAKYVKALDRLLPLLQNWKNEGHSWKKYGITYEQVMKRNKRIEQGSSELWEFAQEIFDDSVKRNLLK